MKKSYKKKRKNRSAKNRVFASHSQIYFVVSRGRINSKQIYRLRAPRRENNRARKIRRNIPGEKMPCPIGEFNYYFPSWRNKWIFHIYCSQLTRLSCFIHANAISRFIRAIPHARLYLFNYRALKVGMELFSPFFSKRYVFLSSCVYYSVSWLLLRQL